MTEIARPRLAAELAGALLLSELEDLHLLNVKPPQEARTIMKIITFFCQIQIYNHIYNDT